MAEQTCILLLLCTIVVINKRFFAGAAVDKNTDIVAASTLYGNLISGQLYSRFLVGGGLDGGPRKY